MEPTSDKPRAVGAADEALRTRITPKSPRESIAPEPAPALPRSRSVRNPIVVTLNAIISLAMLAVICAGAVLYYGKMEFDRAGPLAEEKTVLIPNASGLSTIADLLEREGIIEDRYIFMGGVSAYRQSGRLKAGEYAFGPGMSMRHVMDLLVSGKAIMHRITVPEGLTSQQIVARLNADPILSGDIAGIPAEGTLLPETYTFTRGTTRQQIIDQMIAAHDRVLAEVWERRVDGLPVETPADLVTLASIVEKETGRADERPLVAAVFLNRLRKGMRLQSDPTIVYGIVGGSGPLGRSLTRSDIDTPTPYNTYTIDGLPPGPIANPGRAALEAVSQPSVTEDLYFVADGTGGHAFARTLDEHNRNVARWRQVERQRASEAEAAAIAAAAEPAETAETTTPADPLDLLDGQPRRDPALPVFPPPKPAGG